MQTPDIRAQHLLLDVRPLWNDEPPAPQSRTKISQVASGALSLVPEADRSRAEAFLFLKDGKLSLGSALLKRVFVVRALAGSRVERSEGVDAGRVAAVDGTQTAVAGRVMNWGVTWDEIKFGRKGDDKYGKPCYIPSSTRDGANDSWTNVELDFNTTHQAGLVLLSGLSFPASTLASNPSIKDTSKTSIPPHQPPSIGVDITCTSERRTRDLTALTHEGGVEGFARVHESAFSEEDLDSIIHGGEEGESPDDGLRRFYAFWALKEALVKMEGEALLAPWLREVHFRGVRVPRAASYGAGRENDGEGDGEGEGGSRWGECVDGIEVWTGGVKREGVRLWLQAFEQDYLVATAVLAGDGVEVAAPVWDEVDFERDIVSVAKGRGVEGVEIES